MVISLAIELLQPSITAPRTCCSAPLGLMIWLPTSPATQILLILILFRVDAQLYDRDEISLVRKLEGHTDAGVLR